MKKTIEKSIIEVLSAPANAVLPTFLDVDDSSMKTAVTSQEKEIMELRQDMNRLLGEVQDYRPIRSSKSIERREAERMVRYYVESGAKKSIILRKLTQRGAPPAWVRREIEKYEDIINS